MLKPIKLGSIGPIVDQWQTFLRGQGFLVEASGIFDPATDAATRAFQKRHQLDIDGKVGNQTFGFAGTLGFELVDQTEVDTAYPPLPDFPPLVSDAARQAIFGPLEFVAAPTADNPEAIRITNGWEGTHLVRVTLPQLVGIAGANPSGRVFFHKKGAAQLQGLWAAWQERGLLHRVLDYGGAFNPRFVRGSSTQLSNHAFGTAFDINVPMNRLGTEPAPPAVKGCVYELVPLAHQFGFFWGGHFSRRDGMHFELARLLV